MRKLKNINILLIDDNDEYRYLFTNRLGDIGVNVTGSFAHNQAKDISELRRPDITVLCYRESLDITQETIELVRTKFPHSKIIVSVSQEDKQTVLVDQLQQGGINGLFYKDDISLPELQAVVETVKEGKSYFQNPNKKFP